MMPPSDPITPKLPDLESTEARMRRALGLAGGLDARSEQQRPDQQRAKVTPRASVRSIDRPSGDRPRQRFVHDGEVPVTVVSRARHHDADASAAPGVGRIGVVETALVNERAARAAAERSLHEALATVHDLQTKQGHAELAQREASEAARATHDAAARALRVEWHERETRLAEELAAERDARAAAEAALHNAVIAREQAEQGLHAALAAKSAPEPRAAGREASEPKAAQSPVKRARKAAASPGQREPQPVKWWLKATTKR